MRHFFISLICVSLFLSASSGLAEDKQLSPAQQRQQSLDILLGKLHQLNPELQPEAAASVTSRVLEEWAHSTSPTADLLLAQASLAIADDDVATAQDILNQAVKSYPHNAEAWNRRSIAFFLKGDYAAALSDIDRALELEPRHFGAYAGRGLIYQRQGKWSEARQAYARALAINPALFGVKAALHEVEKHERDS